MCVLLLQDLVPCGVCFITAGPITKLFVWGGEESGGHVLSETTSPGLCGCGTREEPRVRLFSLVPLVWESNPKLQGGWSIDRPFIVLTETKI